MTKVSQLKSFFDTVAKKNKQEKKLQHKEGKNRNKNKKQNNKNKKHNKKNYKSRTGAVLVADEEFHRIKDECYNAVQEIIDAGEPFFDEEFNLFDPELCLETIYGQKTQPTFAMKEFKDLDYRLVRITDAVPEGIELSVFYDGASATDIVQGYNGTCYFLGALMCVAEHHKFLSQLVVHHSIELGVYGIMFFADEEWTYVIIDDFFPFLANGTLLVSKAVDINELWVSLFEKAYAKFYGSFDMIDHGFGSKAIIDLTGGIPIRIPVVWEVVNAALKSDQYCLCCFLMVSGTDQERIDNGLIPGHMYSILNTVELDGVCLINVRNPHGQGEWNGDYSDNSKKWTPRLKQACQHVNKDDGSFWMEFKDFAEWFGIDAVRLFTREHGYSKLMGESWFEFEDTDNIEEKLDHLYNEGYYVLDLHEDADVALCLTQADPDKCEDWNIKRNDLFAIGYSIARFNCEIDDIFDAFENNEFELIYDTGPLV